MPGVKQFRGKKAVKHRNSLHRNRFFFRPRLEALEDRCVPATVNVWSAPAGPPSNWNSALNWSLGHVPTSSEVATFSSTSQTFCSIDAPVAGTNTVSGINITSQYSGQIQDTADMIIGTDGFAQAGGAFSIDFFMPGNTTIFDAGNWSEAVPPPFGGFLAGPGSTVDFNSTTSQTILDNNTQFFNLTHSGAGTLNLTPGPNPFLPIAGNFTNSNGTVDAHGASLMIGGNWTDTSSVINLGTVTFNPFSPAPQTISSNSDFNNVTYIGPPPALLQLLTPVSLTGNFTVSSGTFDANGQDMTVAGNWSNSGVVENTNNVTFNGGMGTTQLLDNGPMSSLHNVIHSGAGTLQLSNNSLVVTGTLNNSGGTLEANGLNLSITGLTTLGAGIVQNTGAADTITLAGGLNITGGSLSTGLGTAILGADVTVTATPFTLPFINGNLDLGGANRTFTVNISPSSSGLYIGAAISDGALTKAGDDSLTLLHANSYSGGTFINAGIVNVDADRALGPGTGGTTVASGAVLTFDNNQPYTPHEPVTLNGGTLADVGVGTTVSFGGTITLGAPGSSIGWRATVLNGLLILNGPINAGKFDLTANGNGDFVLNGPINGTSAATLTMQGTGSLTLNAASNYGGGTTVLSGTLAIGNDNALGTGPLTLNGILAHIGAISLNNPITVNGATIFHQTADPFALNGVISGIGGLNILGANGNLILTANNTYSGTTTVNAGVLTLTGSIPNSAVVLNTGGIVGHGTIGPLTVNDGAFVDPSGATDGDPGILTTGNVQFNGGLLEITVQGTVPGTGYSQLRVNGTVNLGNGVASLLDFTPLKFANGTKLRLIDNDGADAVSGFFFGLPEGSIFTDSAGNRFQITYHGGDGNDVVLTTVSKFDDLIGRVSSNGQWWLNTSTGSSFSASQPLTWSTAVTWVDVVTGDFNGDGFTDLAGRAKQTGDWWVSLSNGSGGFTTTKWATWSTGATWVDVKVGDFNGDGKADITARALENGQWYTGLSNGTVFNTSLWASWSTGATWVDVKVGDFNGDGKADITARALQNGQWYTGLSNGSTAFNTSLWASWSTGATWVDVQAGDFNGDGSDDITARYQQGGSWWTALSNGSAFVTTPAPWATWSTGATWVDVHVGDFNGDGKADIIGRALQNGQWYVALSNGSNGFTTTHWDTWSTGATWVDVQVGDFNGDGKSDIAGRASQNGQWYVGLSNGSAFSTTLWAVWSTAVSWVDVREGAFI